MLFCLSFYDPVPKNGGLRSSAFLLSTSEKSNVLDLEVSRYNLSFEPKIKKTLASVGLGNGLADPLLKSIFKDKYIVAFWFYEKEISRIILDNL
jgi:hypothetical protein